MLSHLFLNVVLYEIYRKISRMVNNYAHILYIFCRRRRTPDLFVYCFLISGTKLREKNATMPFWNLKAIFGSNWLKCFWLGWLFYIPPILYCWCRLKIQDEHHLKAWSNIKPWGKLYMYFLVRNCCAGWAVM